MNSMLAKVVAENQKDWDEKLPFVMGAYRASINEATGFTPNFLMLGHEVRAPVDLLYGTPPEDEASLSYDDYAERKVKVMRDAYALVRGHLGVSAQRMKKKYDMRVKPNTYPIGSWVYYYNPRRYMGKSPKWQRLFTGPFLVVREIGPVNVVLQLSRRSKPFVVHIDKIKQYYGETPKNWTTESKENEPEGEEEIRPAVVEEPPDEEIPNLRRQDRLRKSPSRFHDYVKYCDVVMKDRRICREGIT